MAAQDHTGDRFGSLVAVRRWTNCHHGNVRFLCKCDCGGWTVVHAGTLRSGGRTSCGCARYRLDEEAIVAASRRPWYLEASDFDDPLSELSAYDDSDDWRPAAVLAGMASDSSPTWE